MTAGHVRDLHVADQPVCALDLGDRVETHPRDLEDVEEQADVRVGNPLDERDGVVTAARDLQAVDHEVGQLAERERVLEDEEILLMEEEEPLDEELLPFPP